MNRNEWNRLFAERMCELVDVPYSFALASAAVSDDAFNDGETPEDAVATEIDYWGQET